MDVQDSVQLFYIMRWGAGLTVVIGAIRFIYSQLVPCREIIDPTDEYESEGA